MSEHVPELALVPQGTKSLFYLEEKAWERVKTVAKFYADSDFVPQRYQGKQANCLIAMNLAQRSGTDELLIMQHMYVIHGNPAIDTQLALAWFNATGKYETIEYKLDKGSDNWKCVATVKNKNTGKIHEGPEVSLEMARAEGWSSKQGSKWKTLPELMLRYRAAIFLIRTIEPGCLMGLYTREEVYDTVDLEAQENGSYATPQFSPRTKTEKLLREIKPEQETEAPPKREPVPESPDPQLDGEEVIAQFKDLKAPGVIKFWDKNRDTLLGASPYVKTAWDTKVKNVTLEDSVRQHMTLVPPTEPPPVTTEPPPEDSKEEGTATTVPVDDDREFYGRFERKCMEFQKRFQSKYGFEQGNDEYFAVFQKFDCKNAFDLTDKKDRQLVIEAQNALADALNAL